MMFRFTARRISNGIALLLVVTTAAYSLLYFSGGDIARSLLGQYASPEQVAAKSASLGLDRPFVERYADWISHAVRGDFGSSWRTGQDVTAALLSHAPTTLSLVVCSTLVTVVAAVALGVLGALRPGPLDRLVQGVALIGFALPNFIIVIVLVLVFALGLGWFPATGYTAFAKSPTGWLLAITLPVVAISLQGVAAVSSQVRGSILDLLERDFVRTLRASGLSRRRVLLRHVLRNAAGPSATVLSLQVINLLSGSIIVEQIFALPGLGQLAVTSTVGGDVPQVMGVIVLTVLLVIVVNLLIDLLNAWLNPKVRLS